MQGAGTWAMTKLTQEFGLEYNALYQQEKKTRPTYQSASSRAKVLLTHRHWNRYQELRKEAISLGYPKTNTKRKTTK